MFDDGFSGTIHDANDYDYYQRMSPPSGGGGKGPSGDGCSKAFWFAVLALLFIMDYGGAGVIMAIILFAVMAAAQKGKSTGKPEEHDGEQKNTKEPPNQKSTGKRGCQDAKVRKPKAKASVPCKDTGGKDR